jgi:hypothetical protein
MTVKYLRLLDDKYVYHANEILMKRVGQDLYPCDKDGNFLVSGETEMPVAAIEPVKEKKPKENAAVNQERVKLLDRAKALGIRSAHTMKNETILAKISAMEKVEPAGGADAEAEAVVEGFPGEAEDISL